MSMDDRRPAKSILSKEWHITGELSVANDAVIEGRVDGVLRSTGQLDLSQSARITGTVIGESIRIAGQAEADVVGQTEVELLPGAKMRGRVFSHRFCVNEGAGFRGEIWVDSDAMKVAQQEVLAQLDSSNSQARTASPKPADAELSSQELAMLTSDTPGSNGPRSLRMRGNR